MTAGPTASGAERFLARARAAGLSPEVREFPAGTRTAADAAEAIGCDLAAIVKSLVFIASGSGRERPADDRPVLVLTSGANRVSESALAEVLGAASVRKADAAEVRDATGYAIGGTPPFGHATDLEVVCDADLTRLDEVWAAAGTPTTVFALTPDALLEVTGARVADVGT
ncbi:MAG: YbaK/EbsC family protein [Nitriliruptor sp.]|uniref:YbaK/EbsC family protein n=1 Tax=Nitriliruptor sp. TaxID=2448056 RepID=UPI0034A06E7B